MIPPIHSSLPSSVKRIADSDATPLQWISINPEPGTHSQKQTQTKTDVAHFGARRPSAQNSKPKGDYFVLNLPDLSVDAVEKDDPNWKQLKETMLEIKYSPSRWLSNEFTRFLEDHFVQSNNPFGLGLQIGQTPDVQSLQNGLWEAAFNRVLQPLEDKITAAQSSATPDFVELDDPLESTLPTALLKKMIGVMQEMKDICTQSLTNKDIENQRRLNTLAYEIATR